MNVDLKGSLVDDISAFDGLEEWFVPNNATDIFRFCVPDEGQLDTGVVAGATPNLVSSDPSTGLVMEKDGNVLKGEWGKEEQARAGLRVDPPVVQAIPIPTKPRARKRQEEDQALERGDLTHPMLKIRASPGCIVLGDLPSGDSGDGLPLVKVSGRSSSFDVAAPLPWNSPTTETRVIDMSVSTSLAETAVHTPVHPSPKFAPRKARGGAIKVKKHLLSPSTRPRISVFMSKPRAKAGAPTPTPSLRTDHSPRFGSVVVPSVVSPGNYSLSLTPPMESTLTRSASASRTKDLRVVVRAPVKTEQSVMEMSPVVVPMGIRRGSTPVLDGTFSPPVLQRATSVGALTLTGDVEAFSRSPRVGAAAAGISSYELSEHVQGSAGQRRNLVCKVLGSPLSGPTHGCNS